ncbi:hypothetical protein GGR27_003926 [Lewinella antarctica]|uniref:Uncharacterized protein n=1 Tax=Neolewinella antarctica TaxID=442734 RepID=A0ABX0XGE2_9BACT|nr:hypothetical protein [Neolewinella antarctica]
MPLFVNTETEDLCAEKKKILIDQVIYAYKKKQPLHACVMAA